MDHWQRQRPDKNEQKQIRQKQLNTTNKFQVRNYAYIG